jgi:pyruvate formate lyase activating enzyme
LLGSGVHKALETSGYAPAETFAAVCAAFDLVMLDLKLMDDAAHRRYTGVSNAPILRNAALLCQGQTPFVVRIPLIPGVNDGAEHARAVARLIAGAPALLRVELLPYHKTAGAKYPMLGKPYAPGFDAERPVSPQLSMFEEYGIRSCVL